MGDEQKERKKVWKNIVSVGVRIEGELDLPFP